MDFATRETFQELQNGIFFVISRMTLMVGVTQRATRLDGFIISETTNKEFPSKRTCSSCRDSASPAKILAASASARRGSFSGIVSGSQALSSSPESISLMIQAYKSYRRISSSDCIIKDLFEKAPVWCLPYLQVLTCFLLVRNFQI